MRNRNIIHKKCYLCIKLPGQRGLLQDLDSVAFPSIEQFLPPCIGTGLSHERFLYCTPIPQLFEQSVKFDQLPYPPLTVKITKNGFPVLPLIQSYVCRRVPYRLGSFFVYLGVNAVGSPVSIAQLDARLCLRRSVTIPKSRAMALSTTGLVNVHVIFVFRHRKHLMY